MNLIDLLITLVLGLIMFGIGSSLTFDDIRSVFKNSKGLTTGLTFQMVLLPIFAFLIAIFSDLSPELKVGLIMISICPGGATSNFISYLVNANTALSVSMTTINSILIMLTIPLISNYALHTFTNNEMVIELSIADTFSQVFLTLIVPALLGLYFNRYFKEIASYLKKPMKYINVFLLAVVFLIKFFAGENDGGSGITTAEIFKILPYCLTLHLGSLIISYLVSKNIIGLPNKDATTIGIEVGLQNTTLALLVTGTIIGNTEMTKPALVFAIFSFFTTIAFAIITTPNIIKNGKLLLKK